MPNWSPACRLALILLILAGCSHGGGGDDNDSGPRTNIDLTVTNFSATPSAADPEDSLTLTGTIQNIGSETANPMQGDSFLLRFNLSLDGTFEFGEEGFFQVPITDPIPPGESINFSYTAPYGNGDTQSIFGNFCNSSDCVPPETGVVGVKVDAADVIKEVEEKNNFQFVTHEVHGTRVAVVFRGCDFGNCELIISDGLYSFTDPWPCTGSCLARKLAFPNELHRRVFAVLVIRNCTQSQSPGGSCGASWMIESETQKPGLPAHKKQYLLSCLSTYPGTSASCAADIEIRDQDY